MKKNLYLVGGGGHCRSCIDVIEASNEFEIRGIFDQAYPELKSVLKYPVLGKDSDLAKFVSAENYFLVTVGQIKTSEIRVKIYQNLVQLGARLATVISPRAYVSKHAKIGLGTIVMHDVLVNANATVKENCILNTKSLIEHDALIGSHCHVSTAAIVNGHCELEEMSMVGSNAVLKQTVRVSRGTIVPAGSFYRGE